MVSNTWNTVEKWLWPLTGALLVALSLDAALAAEQSAPRAEQLAAVDRFMVVDCLLPGQVRRIGTKVTYLSQRRPAKIIAGDCEVRGGEYVSYDRARLETALAVWLPPAQSGDKEAQTYVGEVYEKSLGGAAPDYAAAATWYRKAAEQGSPRALMNLGLLYERGLGVEKDLAKAMEYYRKSSGMGPIIIADDPGSAVDSSARNQEIDRLKRELEETKQQLERARQELDQQKGANQSELKRLQGELQKATAAGNVDLAKKLTGQRDQYQAKVDQQQLEITRLEQSLQRARDELAKAGGENTALRQQLTALETSLAATNKELDTRKAQAIKDQQSLDALASTLKEARREASAKDQRDRVSSLEAEIKQKQDELGRQSKDISRLEQESTKLQDQLAKLEASQKPNATESKIPATVEMAPPNIQLIDPPMLVTRGAAEIKLRGAVLTRELVGRVSAPAGLLSFNVNDQTATVDANGLFKTQVQMAKGPTPVRMVAVDRRGRNTMLDFSLVPEESAETRVKPAAPRAKPGEYGEYYALVIGNQQYQHLPKLDTAVADAQAVGDLLQKHYGFKVTALINATRYQILSELNKLRAKLTEKDNLMIYYAGHGELDRANLRGHWLPVDAEHDNDANWISSVAITDILNAMTVKHVLVVADSCYSGAMTRNSIGQLDAGMSDDSRLKWLKALSQARCRTVLTSGGLQPVIDGGGGKHSIFALSFLEVLEGNQELLETQRLFREVAARVMHRAEKYKVEQRPEYAPLKFAGHESGDFLFVPVN
jgi:TPR repeat protein